ncbi:hypothetical protein [Mycoplasmopsis citelli]|nr:hypothetical protein [Mycoplasmopsis citelli]
MKNYKRKVIIWLILSIISFVMIIILSYVINFASSTIYSTSSVVIEKDILDVYKYVRAYAIGGLSFFCIVFVMGSITSYAGIKSWKYSEMF